MFEVFKDHSYSQSRYPEEKIKKVEEERVKYKAQVYEKQTHQKNETNHGNT